MFEGVYTVLGIDFYSQDQNIFSPNTAKSDFHSGVNQWKCPEAFWTVIVEVEG